MSAAQQLPATTLARGPGGQRAPRAPHGCSASQHPAHPSHPVCPTAVPCIPCNLGTPHTLSIPRVLGIPPHPLCVPHCIPHTPHTLGTLCTLSNTHPGHPMCPGHSVHPMCPIASLTPQALGASHMPNTSLGHIWVPHVPRHPRSWLWPRWMPGPSQPLGIRDAGEAQRTPLSVYFQSIPAALVPTALAAFPQGCSYPHAMLPHAAGAPQPVCETLEERAGGAGTGAAGWGRGIQSCPADSREPFGYHPRVRLWPHVRLGL